MHHFYTQAYQISNLIREYIEVVNRGPRPGAVAFGHGGGVPGGGGGGGIGTNGYLPGTSGAGGGDMYETFASTSKHKVQFQNSMETNLISAYSTYLQHQPRSNLHTPSNVIVEDISV